MDFKIHRFKGTIQVVYLVEYKDKVLLLDGAARPDKDRIIDFVTRRMNRPLSDLKLSVVSHYHPDHCGAAILLQKEHGIPIATYKETSLWYKGIGGHLQYFIDTSMAHYVARKQNKKRQNLWTSLNFKPDYLLEDMQKLPFFEDWLVLHSPGHTSHQITLYNQNNKILYAADTILRINGKCVLPFPVELPQWQLWTLNRLEKLDIEKILMPHGGVCNVEDKSKLFLNLKQILEIPLSAPLKYLKPFTAFNKEVRRYKRNFLTKNT